jgi:NADH-quinone oxidoreductase subunit C/D
MVETSPAVVEELQGRFGVDAITWQPVADDIPTVWTSRDRIVQVLHFLKYDIPRPYRMLLDLTGIDERTRVNRKGQPPSDFTVVYCLLSFDRNGYVRVKVPLEQARLSIPSVISVWKCANWYERELWDMFGIQVDGHPHLRRILMPPTWVGHPLRKDHAARATEFGPYELTEEREDYEQEALLFRPEEWGMKREHEGSDFMFLNVGPQHPGTHGVLRIVLQLDGEEIVDAVPDIGYHHRAAEKMGERQTWHTYIPYTDRVDYLSGVVNELAYVLPVETLAGIELPARAQVIRVLLSELFRIANHLVWFGTFAQDVGQMSPVFYAFNDRERAFAIVEAICGARMHPNFLRIGGSMWDLPKGWDTLVRDFLKYLPPRLAEYDKAVMRNGIFIGRTKGVGAHTTEQALEWGVTGPNLRACGFEWDLRKKQPYSGYENFEFDIPTAHNGDCYDRAVVRLEEMRQSLRIMEQCVDNMPEGPYKARHPLTTPPIKEPNTMHDIETLITHFLNVTWGPVIPPGEAARPIEASKGINFYYVISDGNTQSYRTRIRTPSFPHLQMLPVLTRGAMIADLLAVLGAMDYVLADVDR